MPQGLNLHLGQLMVLLSVYNEQYLQCHFLRLILQFLQQLLRSCRGKQFRRIGGDVPSENHKVLCAQAWKPGSQHAGEKRGVAGLLLGRTERAARAAELQLCAQARQRKPRPRGCSGLGEPRPALPSFQRSRECN